MKTSSIFPSMMIPSSTRPPIETSHTAVLDEESVVLDTCVLIGAYYERYWAEKCLEMIATRKKKLYLSTYIEQELHNVLIGKLQENAEKVSAFWARIKQLAVPGIQNPRKVYTNRCADEQDWPILGTALRSRAGYLVSFDKDLTNMADFEKGITWQGIKILQPDQWLRIVTENQEPKKHTPWLRGAVVLDASILVARYEEYRLALKTFERIHRERLGLYISKYILKDTEDILIEKKYPREHVTKFLGNLVKLPGAQVIRNIEAHQSMMEYSERNQVALATAVAARATKLISVRSNLLRVYEHDGVNILHPIFFTRETKERQRKAPIIENSKKEPSPTYGSTTQEASGSTGQSAIVEISL